MKNNGKESRKGPENIGKGIKSNETGRKGERKKEHKKIDDEDVRHNEKKSKKRGKQ